MKNFDFRMELAVLVTYRWNTYENVKRKYIRNILPYNDFPTFALNHYSN